MKKTLLVIFCLQALMMQAYAQELTLGPLFTDHMILQQQQSAPLV